MGRFGYRYMLDGQRLRRPLVKGEKGLQESSWDQAFEQAATAVTAIMKKYGPGSVAVCASPRMSNEEQYLLQKFARTGLRTNMVGSFSNLLNYADLGTLDDMFGLTASTTTMDEFVNADVIMVMNAELTENNLIVDLKIKEAMKKGARLVSVNSSENTFSRIADLWLKPKRGTNTALIAGIANALIKKGKLDLAFIEGRSENFKAFKASISGMNAKNTISQTGVQHDKFNQIVDMLAQATNLVIVYGMDESLEKSPGDLKALGNLILQLGNAGKPGNGLVLVRRYANSQGLIDMGVDSSYLPGFIRAGHPGADRLQKLWNVPIATLFKPTDLLKNLKQGKVKAILIFGEDPLASSSAKQLLAKVEFKLVADFFRTATADAADVVLPMSTPLESDGTYTACDRRVQRSAAIMPPLTGMTNLEMIAGMAGKLGMLRQSANQQEIFKEIAEANPYYRGVGESGFWGNELFKEKFPTLSGKATFSPVAIAKAARKEGQESVLSTSAYFLKNIKEKLHP
jgi:formate dehydrogenase major subunit